MIYNPCKIAKHVMEHGLVILNEVDFNEQQYIDFIKEIGECEAPDLFMNPKEYPEIFLVTGQKKEGKKIGMFGSGELGWHSNGNSRHLIDKILISLYCVKGCPNTTLSVCSTSLPFYELPEEEKEYWRSIKIRLKFQNNTMYNLEEGDPELEFMSKNKGSIRSLVGKHPHTGEEYFYFPYHFIIGAWEGKKKIDHEEVIEKLKPIIFKSKFMHHHIFQEGDLLMMDQFTTLHRRTAVADDTRLLWRIASDYRYVV